MGQRSRVTQQRLRKVSTAEWIWTTQIRTTFWRRSSRSWDLKVKGHAAMTVEFWLVLSLWSISRLCCVQSSEEDLFGDDEQSLAKRKRKKPAKPVVALADTGKALRCYVTKLQHNHGPHAQHFNDCIDFDLPSLVMICLTNNNWNHLHFLVSIHYTVFVAFFFFFLCLLFM